MLLGFTGEYQQRVDGKGRMSIPADFRRVLEAGDPEAKAAGANPGLYLLYGPHLNGRLTAQTVESFSRQAEAIMAIRPKSAEEARQRRLAQVSILGNAVRLDVDRDGRIVLPLRQREKIGLTEGEVVFLGLGDTFEIWPLATYEAQVGAQTAADLADLGEGYDPMTAIWQMTG